MGPRPLSSLVLGLGMGDMGLWAKRPLDSLQAGQLRNRLSPWNQLEVGLRGGSLKGKKRLPFPNRFLKVKGQDSLSSH